MVRGGPVALLAVLVLLPAALAGCGGPARSAAPGAGIRSPVAAGFHSTRTYQPVAPPVRLRIPAAHVDSGLQRLDRLADGTIAVPSRPGTAGWYTEGPRPGQPGPAVILGHVDSRTGPAVFYHVAELRHGDAVYVDRADGTTVRFRVSTITQVPKKRFPADLVYSPSLEPSLRLVTCGGLIDPATGHYRDNVIIFADPG